VPHAWNKLVIASLLQKEHTDVPRGAVRTNVGGKAADLEAHRRVDRGTAALADAIGGTPSKGARYRFMTAPAIWFCARCGT
jgi:hypothetical protein